MSSQTSRRYFTWLRPEESDRSRSTSELTNQPKVLYLAPSRGGLIEWRQLVFERAHKSAEGTLVFGFVRARRAKEVTVAGRRNIGQPHFTWLRTEESYCSRSTSELANQSKVLYLAPSRGKLPLSSELTNQPKVLQPFTNMNLDSSVHAWIHMVEYEGNQKKGTVTDHFIQTAHHGLYVPTSDRYRVVYAVANATKVRQLSLIVRSSFGWIRVAHAT